MCTTRSKYRNNLVPYYINTGVCKVPPSLRLCLMSLSRFTRCCFKYDGAAARGLRFATLPDTGGRLYGSLWAHVLSSSHGSPSE